MSEQVKPAHTPGPWEVGGTAVFPTVIAGTRFVADFFAVIGPDRRERQANAARIVACVNACEGVANPAAVPELVAACRLIVGWLAAKVSIGDPCRNELHLLRDALHKVTIG